jgi:hypothetical protein
MSGHELRTAYEQSRREYVSRCERTVAERWAEVGRYPICLDHLVRCPRTDAVLAGEVEILSVHEHRDEAWAELEGMTDDADCQEDAPYIMTSKTMASNVGRLIREAHDVWFHAGEECPF